MSRRTLARLAGLLAVCAVSSAVAEEWREVAPPDTTCWDGKPWHFWYRTGQSDNLVIYFQGGGGCWRSELCDITGQPTFDRDLTAEDHPSRSGGLFDDSHADNPVRGWRAAFLPYCTGDVHVGRRTVEYTRADGSTYTVAHEGQRNVRAALDWIAARIVAEGRPPPRIFVSGESAGAIAASFWAYEIGDRFPDAALSVVGDAAGGYRTAHINGLLRQWGTLDALPAAPAFADPGKVYLESFYLATAQRHPDAHLAQINFADDAVQRRFMDLMGAPTDVLTKGLTCNLNEIRIDSPNFHSYIYPGTEHIMLRTGALYETTCEGERLVDWIGRVVEGQPVVNRWCDGTAAVLTEVSIPRI
jgi:hypothetical protein